LHCTSIEYTNTNTIDKRRLSDMGEVGTNRKV